MAKERIPYIDAAKGLLILIIIGHHIPLYADVICQHVAPFYIDAFGHNPAGNDIAFLSMTNWIKKLQPFYSSFFMSAFFIITGLCSSFDKKFWPFLYSNAKYLLLPNCLYIILRKAPFALAFGQPFDIVTILRNILITGGEWFTITLFIAKVIYWFAGKYLSHDILRCFVLLMLLLVGAVLYGRVHEVWYFWHALALMPFLEIGRILRVHPLRVTMRWACPVAFLILVCVYSFVGKVVPKVSYSSMITVMQAIPFLLMATMGTIGILEASKFVQTSRVLRFFGRNSLIAYYFHTAIIMVVINWLVATCDVSVAGKFIIPLVTFVAVAAFTALVICIFNLPVLRWCQGKFN